MEVRPAGESDRPWVAECCRRAFGSPEVAVGAQVVLLAADSLGRGAGTALLAALEVLGVTRGRHRLRLLSTNDNTAALRFYQRRGGDLVALHRDAVAGDRALKPEIPAVGRGGIPIQHLLELERRLELREEPPA